jgi:hypothetical protein
MATAFDGLGMGMLGSERGYMGGGSSDIKFLLGSLLKKGLDGKSNVPLPAWPAFDENKSNVAVPPENTNIVPQNPNPAPVQPQSNEHPETGTVLKDLGLTSFLQPDTLKQRDTSLDQTPLQMASVPPPMNLPQHGQDGGDGSNLMSIVSTLGSLFI